MVRQNARRFLWELCALFKTPFLEPQSRFGDKPLTFQVICPQNWTEVLNGLPVLEARRSAFHKK